MSAADIDRERLAKLLGMLGSAHPGEVVNAARMVEGLRRAAGVTWADIVVGVPQLAPAADIDDSDAGRLRWRFERLTPWERNFILSVSRQRYRLTAKQRCVLNRLAAKAAR